MERVRPNFTPEWEGPIAGWAVNYARKNLWRVTPEFDMDDLIQDAFIYFADCRRRYGYVNQPKHFMALFQTCFRNHITELSNRRTRRPDICEATLGVAEEGETITAGAESLADGDLAALELELLIEDAPGPIRDILRRLQSQEGGPTFRRGENGLRETTREYLIRVAGLEPGQLDILGMLRGFFDGTFRGPQPLLTR